MANYARSIARGGGGGRCTVAKRNTIYIVLDYSSKFAVRSVYLYNSIIHQTWLIVGP